MKLIRECKREGTELDAVAMRGDSKSALAWAMTQRVRSESVESAAAIFALVLARYRIHVIDVGHVAGVDNGRGDALSRMDGTRSVEDILGEGMYWRLGDDEVVGEVLGRSHHLPCEMRMWPRLAKVSRRPSWSRQSRSP